MSKLRCGQSALGVNGDVRTMWIFGLKGEERREASICNRAIGHRGKHRNRPLTPPYPYRSILIKRR